MSIHRAQIAIILLNYNSFDDTNECINSINQVSYPNKEIIVVDNASHDDSLERLKKAHPKLVTIKNHSNLGFSKGCNVGIKKAMQFESDYILLLNNDTVVDKNFLEPLVEAGEKEKRVGILIGKIHYYGSNKIWYGGSKKGFLWDHHRGQGETDNGQYDRVKFVNFASGCMMLIKRNVIEECGLLDERFFFGGEDRVYCNTVQKKGFLIKYIPSSVIKHKVSASYKMSPQKVYNGYLVSQLYIKTVYHPFLSPLLLALYRLYSKLALKRLLYSGYIINENKEDYQMAINRAFKKGSDPSFLSISYIDCFQGLDRSF